MKKLFLVLFAIMVAVSMASASDTRVASIGAASTFLTDYTDIYLLPSVLTAYPRLISAELGMFPTATAQRSASVTFTNDEAQSWGVFGVDFNHAIYGEQTFAADIALLNAPGTYWQTNYAALVIPALASKYHLFYAKKVGSLTAGLHIARAAGSHTGDYTDSVSNWKEDNHSGIWSINAGVSLAPMNNVTADAAVAFNLLSFKADYTNNHTLPAPAIATGGTIENDGGSDISIGARAFYGMTDELKIVPVVGVNLYSLGYKTSYVDTAENRLAHEGGKKSITNVIGGIGLNYRPIEKVLLVGGLQIGYTGTTIEDTTGLFGLGYKKQTISGLMLPQFSAGVEASLLKWMDVRFGASKALNSTSSEYQYHTALTGNVTEKHSSSSAPYTFGFGLGLKFGKLAIDAKVNDDQPFSLGYLMSGNTAERVPFTQVSATYQF